MTGDDPLTTRPGPADPHDVHAAWCSTRKGPHAPTRCRALHGLRAGEMNVRGAAGSTIILRTPPRLVTYRFCTRQRGSQHRTCVASRASPRLIGGVSTARARSRGGAKAATAAAPDRVARSAIGCAARCSPYGPRFATAVSAASSARL
jgi:hypothetical protein